MLKDNSGNVIIAQFSCSNQSTDFYNLVVTGEGHTGVYVSDGCDFNGENLGFDEVSGLHYPGNVNYWAEFGYLIWKSFIEVGMTYSEKE